MTKIKIKLGNPQPLPCPHCKDKFGYKIVENIKTTYSTFYDEYGEHAGGDYGDSMKHISGGITAYCLNCANKLPFIIDKS